MTVKDTTWGEQLATVLKFYGLISTVEQQQMKIVCPFHGDINPSMRVDFATGDWYCFGCQEGGTPEKFVAKVERLDDPSLNDLQCLEIYYAIVHGRAGQRRLRLPRVKLKTARQLYDEAYDFYHGLSKVDWECPDSEEATRVFGYMRDRGFTSEDLQRAGAKVTYSEPYELVFPIRDNGKFKGWVSRTDDPEVAKYRKYLYNKGFRRVTTVVGDYSDAKPLYIVEGFMDRLKLLHCGVDNVVAIFGWKISDEQVNKLSKAGIIHVISALDNDDCGRKGTEYLRKFFNVTRFQYLKRYKDPGDFTERDCDIMVARTMQRYRQDEL